MYERCARRGSLIYGGHLERIVRYQEMLFDGSIECREGLDRARLGRQAHAPDDIRSNRLLSSSALTRLSMTAWIVSIK
jgi:hypothetical protein